MTETSLPADPFVPTDERARVLVVDDEANARDALVELLTDEGYEVQAAADGRAAMKVVGAFRPHVVLTDLKMPGMDGLALLEAVRAEQPSIALVVMTAFGTIETAVEAMRRGAETYLTKPLDLDVVTVTLERAVEKARLREETAHLRAQVGRRLSFEGIVAEHPSMQRMLKTVAQVAKSRATVLVHGETGTGKELIAAAIHHASKRADGPFVALNCAALAESVLESELFGHERGAFTGAVGRRVGRFESAHRGTLFLDEVSEIPKGTQVKLLRFLQERCFERVGSSAPVEVDVRVVAATNRDLRVMVEDGTFREDLYYRLNVVQIDVPPLRARKTDIPLLAAHFLEKYAEENEIEASGFDDAALRAMVRYPWPGNVRELENAIERAVVLGDGSPISTEHLPSGTQAIDATDPSAMIPGMTLAEIERWAIEAALEAAEGRTAEAAEMLDISQRKIQYRIKAWEQGEDE